MAYGEFSEDQESPDVTISQCDVDALAVTWAAYLAGEDPPSIFQC